MISTSISQRQLILEYLAKEIRSAYCCGAEFFDVTFGTKFDFTLKCFFFTSDGNHNFIELTLDLRKKCLVSDLVFFLNFVLSTRSVVRNPEQLASVGAALQMLSPTMRKGIHVSASLLCQIFEMNEKRGILEDK